MDLPNALPTLPAELVTLRAFTEDDVELIAEASSDPLIPLITTVPTVPDRDQALAYMERQHSRVSSGQGYSFAIARSDTGTTVGQIGMSLRDIKFGRANVGYWIAATERRRGYASAAIHALSTWALSLPSVHRLDLYVEPWNEASWRAAEHAGYQREGLLRSWQVVGQKRRDMYMYSRLKH